MAEFIPALESLVEQFNRLPGIGRKSAVRMALAVLDYTPEQIKAFSEALSTAAKTVTKCKRCYNISDDELCPVCRDESRDSATVCVVEDARDVMSIERVKEYRGVYHVLGGAISPIDGIGPEKLRIKELLERINNNGINEIIVATSPTIEGDTTAMYITKLLRPLGIKVTRLAYGIPVGGELEHADEQTLLRAIQGRREMN